MINKVNNTNKQKNLILKDLEKLSFCNEYEVDEFYYDLSTDIKIKLRKILNY